LSLEAANWPFLTVLKKTKKCENVRSTCSLQTQTDSNPHPVDKKIVEIKL
jgi:hypothetical protein